MKYLLGIAITLLLAACTTTQEQVEETYPNGAAKLIGLYTETDGQLVKISENGYYENGALEIQGSYNDSGQRVGKWKYWYECLDCKPEETGQLWSECEYKDGLRHGISIIYYENGQKRYEGQYANDSTDGKWLFWNDKGTLQKELNY